MLTMTKSIQSYIDSMIDEIKAAAPVNTGALKSSIKSDIKLNDDGFSVDITMLDYGYYLDKGVNGTGPQTPNAKHSVVRNSPYSFKKNISSSHFSKYKNSLSRQFAIATSIRRNGIEPRNFIEPNLDRKLEGLLNLTAEEIFENLKNQFNK